jgi:DNA helicase-2/ATP-dependent DNA helicase PcrA
MAYYRKPYPKAASSDTSAQPAKPKSKWNGYTKPTAVVRGSAYKPILNPSVEQSAIFDSIKNGSGSILIEALAGCGKTSTCVESMYKLDNKDLSVLYVIFANRNAREAESKCPSSTHTSTCHAHGLRAIKAAYGSKVEVDPRGEKSDAIARALLGPEDEKAELRFNFAKALGLAKGYLCESVSDIIEVCDKHGIEVCGETEESFASNVLKGLDLAAQQYMRIDFDDMIWLPIRLNLHITQYDLVYADECQDLSPARIELILRSLRSSVKWWGKKDAAFIGTGRLIAVGDENQAIFAFTGADADAMRKIKTRTNAHTLGLRTTYRCGKAIVAVASQFVDNYIAADRDCDGSVSDIGVEKMLTNAKGGDFILSRVNAPLVSLCLGFIKEGRKAAIAGKDMGRSLTWMIKRSITTNVVDFLSWLETWKNGECERLIAKNKSCDHIVDKADCLCAIAEGTNDLSVMKSRIERLFSDTCEKHNKADCVECGDDRITLSSVHKSKGLERNCVYVLADTLKTDKSQEEKNIAYVAYTRGIQELYLVRGLSK